MVSDMPNVALFCFCTKRIKQKQQTTSTTVYKTVSSAGFKVLMNQLHTTGLKTDVYHCTDYEIQITDRMGQSSRILSQDILIVKHQTILIAKHQYVRWHLRERVYTCVWMYSNSKRIGEMLQSQEEDTRPIIALLIPTACPFHIENKGICYTTLPDSAGYTRWLSSLRDQRRPALQRQTAPGDASDLNSNMSDK